MDLKNLIIIYDNIDSNKSKFLQTKFYSNNNYLKNKTFIYFGIYEKTDSLFINKMKKKFEINLYLYSHL